MIKVLIPQNKGRAKTSIRGFWQNDTGKIYYDYLRISNSFKNQLEYLKNKYNQEAIFYIYKGKGYIYNGLNKLENILNKRKFWIIEQGKILRYKNFIKKIIKQYKGLTIYQEKGFYLLEVFYN